MTYAIVNTKSNYRNLNGKRLLVVEETQNFIACRFMDQGQIITADFGRSEVVEIWSPKQMTDIINPLPMTSHNSL